MVSTLLLVIVLSIIIYVFYTKFIIDNFDVDNFSSRINILKEYLSSVGDNTTVPPLLGYVSHVDNSKYIVTYFNTRTLKTVDKKYCDERIETFSFTNQKFVNVENKNDPHTPSISYVPSSESKFLMFVDDGELEMNCDFGIFDGIQCLPKPICDAPNKKLPLTENLLNRLLFNKFNAQNNTIVEELQQPHHPTLYVKCDSDEKPSIEECSVGENFETDKCVYNPILTTNNKGLIITADINKYKKFFAKKYDIDKNRHRQKSEILGFSNSAKVVDVESFVDVVKKQTGLVKVVPVDTDYNYMFPVNYSYKPFDATPCLNKEIGYTFITPQLNDSQYLECLVNNNIFLHNCKKLNKNEDGSYFCDVNLDCEQCTTETIFNRFTNDNVSFVTGKAVCGKDDLIKTIVECDTGDFITEKIFNHPFKISFELGLPKQIFDVEKDMCVDYSVDKVSIVKDSFKITVEPHPEISYNMIGRVSKITNKDLYMSSSVSGFVTYSKNVNELTLNPENMQVIECPYDGIVYDIFDNTRYYTCENGVQLHEEYSLKENEYIENGSVKQLAGYKGECGYGDEEKNYFDNPYRTLEKYSCYFTIPTKNNDVFDDD